MVQQLTKLGNLRNRALHAVGSVLCIVVSAETLFSNMHVKAGQNSLNNTQLETTEASGTHNTGKLHKH